MVFFMERTMSVEDKIRRAEEIYARRRGRYIESEEENLTKFRLTNSKSNDEKPTKQQTEKLRFCMHFPLDYARFCDIINRNAQRAKCNSALSHRQCVIFEKNHKKFTVNLYVFYL